MEKQKKINIILCIYYNFIPIILMNTFNASSEKQKYVILSAILTNHLIISR